MKAPAVKVKTKPSPSAPPNGLSNGATAVKLSVNVSSDVGMRLRKIAFDERLSESSIVEIALEALFGKSSDGQIGKFLRDNGASLRRVTRDVVR